MQDFTVAVDRSTSPATITFADRFNVAVPFIDRHLNEGRADRTAILTTDGETVTYGALAENVARCGNALLDAGIRPGERLLMVVKDCPAFFYLFWGAIKAGIVPVPLNTLLRAPDYAFMIERAACAGLVYSPEYAAEVEPALAASAHRPRLVLSADAPLMEAMAAASPDLNPHPAHADDDCFWLFSSGSTGRPKAAVHRHRDMVVTSEFYGVGILGLGPDDVVYSVAKLFFAYGLGNAMTFPLWVGGSAVLFPGRPTPETTFETVARFRPSVYYGVPTLYGAQVRVLDEAKPDLSSLRLCVSAGEALPGDILKRWQAATGVPILDGIGSTEALHIFISNRLDSVTPGSTGHIVPGYDAKVVGEDRQPVADGDPGRLMIRGPSTARCYWEEPEKTAATMVGDWLDTGDTYIREADGTFYYCGRSDDMLKVGGMWCSPFEIEARLVEHPAVVEAAVVGRADGAGLVKPHAYVVLADPNAAGAEMNAALLAHVKAGLAPYKYPRWFTYTGDLPKTATGKIQRYKLRAG
ncbi:MAG: benzoate--CoA ligase [Rhodospirillaceae bacterium]|nr:benzoate--CoA ligase [Rhodospirillaceae bacterium]